jgi:hypothetical protein
LIYTLCVINRTRVDLRPNMQDEQDLKRDVLRRYAFGR